MAGTLAGLLGMDEAPATAFLPFREGGLGLWLTADHRRAPPPPHARPAQRRRRQQQAARAAQQCLLPLLRHHPAL
jgi:hypothetical protein